MTEAAGSQAPRPNSPGAMLRAAREARGIHIATLAANIKVSPARLEALEADDYSGMPDTTFARALAQAVCRALKTDPAPVLAQMPESFHSRLERVDEGLNAPFRERSGGLPESVVDGAIWRHPVFWIVVLLLAGAAAFFWWPERLGDRDAPLFPPGADAAGLVGRVEPASGAGGGGVAGGGAASATDEAALAAASAAPLGAPAAAPVSGMTSSTVIATGATTPAAAAASSAAAPMPAATPPAPLPGAMATPPAPLPGAEGDTGVLRAASDTWVQVNDASGRVLLSRTVGAGETVNLSGQLPLRVRIGNVQGTELSFRGQAIDLKALSRDNTARLSLPLEPSSGSRP